MRVNKIEKNHGVFIRILTIIVMVFFSNYVYAQDAVLTPAPGSVFSPDDIVTVEFKVPSGNAEGALFTLSNGKMENVKGSGPYKFTLSLNNQGIGPLEITAMTFGAGQNYMASTHIIIEPKENSLESIEAMQNFLPMDQLGLSLQISIMGHFNDGSTKNMTKGKTGTLYSIKSGTNDIISVSADGLVRANGEGNDVVLISNRGKIASVPVEVRVHVPSQ